MDRSALFVGNCFDKSKNGRSKIQKFLTAFRSIGAFRSRCIMTSGHDISAMRRLRRHGHDFSRRLGETACADTISASYPAFTVQGAQTALSARHSVPSIFSSALSCALRSRHHAAGAAHRGQSQDRTVLCQGTQASTPARRQMEF